VAFVGHGWDTLRPEKRNLMRSWEPKAPRMNEAQADGSGVTFANGEKMALERRRARAHDCGDAAGSATQVAVAGESETPDF